MRLLILVALLSVPASAEWQTLFMTPNGERTEKSIAKPLAHFTTDGLLRGDWGLDTCPKCTPHEKLALNRNGQSKAKVQLLGKLAGFLIYDVYYYYGGTDVIESKSILVKTAPNLYHEVYYVQRSQSDAIIEPSFFVKAGAQLLLGSRDFAGGHHGVVIEEYFWLDANGPARVDLAPLRDAVESTEIPQGFTFDNHGYNNATFFPGLKLEIPVIDLSSCSRGCVSGKVEVTFTMNREKITVTGHRFRAD